MMMVNYGDYFKELGFTNTYYDAQSRQFDVDDITDKIRRIIDKWKTKYPNLRMKLENIKYDSLVNFDLSFTTEIERLNLETNQLNR